VDHPQGAFKGVVVNIPEMRLYYFHPRKAGEPQRVTTYPVGLGRDEWRTPKGKFKVLGKTKNPTWVIPESIRQEHIKERNDPRTMIEGGAADNPLGKYRLELTMPGYRIHGTDIPWGVGMQVSHGCVRLYPEDIEQLFPIVPVGTPGEFIY
jgi:L,D-transpeptidase ErfK/SrfK